MKGGISMPAETVISGLSKIKQEDGSYVTFMPINTVDDVYIDMETKETLRSRLGAMEKDATVKIVRWSQSE